jgi:hypothetical protein
VFIVQAYHTSQYVVPRGGVFLGKWRSSFAGSSDSKMNAQSACALNTRYNQVSIGFMYMSSFMIVFVIARALLPAGRRTDPRNLERALPYNTREVLN